ncbi:uncharacterized protein LOC132734050 [Ruditapes philippinarum]|uniref:uncharacterized protein LOC132734050 n=1 Tax=Ruditapes philippinarum TaxID=129788 RepID=UPI00295BC235|nr:uncharacterized protein LOC132734050 [Ruditapes philippinarum]
MASNSVSSSHERSDIKCSACKEQNKNTSADKYCVDCQDYYCSECLKLHETLPALKSHKLLNTDEDKIGQLKMIPTEKCERHHFKTVDMFCQNHDEVGCATCMATDHRNCKDVFYIPEMIKTCEVKGCEERISSLEKNFKELLDRFNNEDFYLKTNKQSEIDKINSYAKQIEDIIKQAAQDAIVQVEKQYENLWSELKWNYVKIRDQFEKFLAVKECIETTKENKSQAFVTFKLNTDEIVASEQAYEKASHIKLGQRFRFKIDPELKEKLIENRIILGNVKIQTYSFVHKGSYNIRLTSDKNDTHVDGSCVLSDGSIVLADYNNKNIKLVDVRKQLVVDEFIFQTVPTDVCSIERSCKNEIAVCLPQEHKVSVIYILNNKFCSDFDIKLDFYCFGIFCLDNILYISDPENIHLVDFNGKVLRTVSVNVKRHLSSHSQLHNIYVCSKNKNIFASCRLLEGRKLFCINDNGEIINIISKEKAWCSGLADAGNGKVFACGNDSKNVTLLNDRYEIEKVVIKDGLKKPNSMCFDFKSGRLYVSHVREDIVDIFEAD